MLRTSKLPQGLTYEIKWDGYHAIPFKTAWQTDGVKQRAKRDHHHRGNLRLDIARKHVSCNGTVASQTGERAFRAYWERLFIYRAAATRCSFRVVLLHNRMWGQNWE